MKEASGATVPGFAEFMKENELRADAILVRIIVALTVVEVVWFYLMWVDYDAVYYPSEGIQRLEILFKAIAISAYFVMARLGIRGYRYLALSILMAHSYIVSAYISYNLMVLLVLPALLTTLYSDRRLLAVTAPLGLALMLLSLWVYNSHTSLILGFWYMMTDWDILKILIRRYYVYALVEYLVILIVTVYATKKGDADTRNAADLRARSIMAGKELEIAASIQEGMLPSSLPESPELRISAGMVPAKEIGGDFYDCFRMKDGKVAVAIADVSGKGVPAALFMMSSSSVLHSVLDTGCSLEEAVYKANNDVFRSNRMKYFVTLWLGILDTESGSLEYVNAGHNPPFIVSGGKAVRIGCRPDFVFGRKRDVVFHSRRTVLRKGDRLFLYTDGVTEARSSDGGMYGEGRLIQLLEKTVDCDAEGVLNRLQKDVATYVNGASPSDDMTLVALDYLGSGDGTLRVPADRSGYADLMAYLDRRITAEGFRSEKASELRTVCSEIFSNIDMYGFEGRDRGSVEFSLDVADGMAIAVFSDDGVPFDPLEKAVSEPSSDPRDHRKGGLGLIMVRKLSRNLSYERRGDRNVLTISKEI